MTSFKITTGQLAAMLGGSIEGNTEALIWKPTAIEKGEEGGICFLSNPKYEPYLYTTTATAVLVPHDIILNQAVQTTLIRVNDVRASLNALLAQFQKIIEPPRLQTIHLQACIEPEAVLGANIGIGAFAYIGKGATIGENTTIDTQVFIGERVKIGKNVRLHSGVKVYYGCVIGDNCTIHANTVIGADGFGFMPTSNGAYEKVPQIGNVVIGNDVEIGSNCSIDRALMDSTRIGNGVKLDNLIQIAHNVEIGDHTVIAAQTGIAGSTKIGKFCVIGGQVGFAGHIVVADYTQIQGKSGIAQSVKTKNQKLAGNPAFDYTQERRASLVFRSLPDLEKRVRNLEDLQIKPEKKP